MKRGESRDARARKAQNSIFLCLELNRAATQTTSEPHLTPRRSNRPKTCPSGKVYHTHTQPTPGDFGRLACTPPPHLRRRPPPHPQTHTKATTAHLQASGPSTPAQAQTCAPAAPSSAPAPRLPRPPPPILSRHTCRHGPSTQHIQTCAPAWAMHVPSGGGGLSVDRLPPFTHVLGRLLLYYILCVRTCGAQQRADGHRERGDEEEHLGKGLGAGCDRVNNVALTPKDRSNIITVIVSRAGWATGEY